MFTKKNQLSANVSIQGHHICPSQILYISLYRWVIKKFSGSQFIFDRSKKTSTLSLFLSSLIFKGRAEQSSGPLGAIRKPQLAWITLSHLRASLLIKKHSSECGKWARFRVNKPAARFPSSCCPNSKLKGELRYSGAR